MKAKFYLIAAAACAALAACSKNEVAPVDVDQEITFQAVVNKASTKAMIDGNVYATGNTFGSVAYYQSNPATCYIPLSEVKYSTDKWSTETTYYWPKNGKLTFYSFSPYKYQEAGTSTEIAPTVSAEGFVFTNYSVKNHQDTDLMVAEVKKNQTENTTHDGGTWHIGVPTIFHHMLAQVGKITIQTMNDDNTGTKDYANGHDGSVGHEFVAGDKQFIIKEISFKNFYEQGTLTAKDANTWISTGSATSEYIWYKDEAIGTIITKEASPRQAGANSYYLLLPQKHYTSETAPQPSLYVKYVIKSYTDASNYSTETVEVTTPFNTIHGGTIPSDIKGWDMNKIYNYTLKIGLNQIFWDPKVVDWSPDNLDYSI